MRAPNSRLAEASHPVASLEAAERLLVVFLGYAAPLDQEPFTDAGRLGNALAWGLMVLRSPAVRLHVRFYRDFYANPRSPAYMGEVLDRLFATSASQARTLLVGPRVKSISVRSAGQMKFAVPTKISCESHAISTWPATMMRHCLCMPTRSGFRLGAFEQTLVAAFPRQVFVSERAPTAVPARCADATPPRTPPGAG